MVHFTVSFSKKGSLLTVTPSVDSTISSQSEGVTVRSLGGADLDD
jgi:hypothetical protein